MSRHPARIFKPAVASSPHGAKRNAGMMTRLGRLTLAYRDSCNGAVPSHIMSVSPGTGGFVMADIADGLLNRVWRFSAPLAPLLNKDLIKAAYDRFGTWAHGLAILGALVVDVFHPLA